MHDTESNRAWVGFGSGTETNLSLYSLKESSLSPLGGGAKNKSKYYCTTILHLAKFQSEKRGVSVSDLVSAWQEWCPEESLDTRAEQQSNRLMHISKYYVPYLLLGQKSAIVAYAMKSVLTMWRVQTINPRNPWDLYHDSICQCFPDQWGSISNC